MPDFAPTHPGEILLTEFLKPMGISQYRIAKAIDVPARRINEIVHGKRGISADIAAPRLRPMDLKWSMTASSCARRLTWWRHAPGLGVPRNAKQPA